MKLEVLKAKIFNEKNEVLKKFLNRNYIQKYLTPEEIQYIDNLPAAAWEDKLTSLKDAQSTASDFNVIQGYKPKYVYDDKNFYSAEDLANYVYCKKNNVDSFKYVYKIFGPRFFKNVQKKQEYDCKRKIVEIKSEEDINLKVYENRNSNVKIKYFCKKCGRLVLQSPKTVLHFKDLLCPSCRRKKLKI